MTSPDGLGLVWCGEIPETKIKENGEEWDNKEIVWYRQFWVTTRDKKPLAVIHLLKPFAFNPYLFQDNLTLAPNKEGYLYVSQSGVPPHGTHWDAKSRAPAHLQKLEDEPPEMEAYLERLRKKVTYFAKSGRTPDFPQTSTGYQWYDMEHFEAYQSLGYLMGRAYLSQLEFAESALTIPPGVECTGGR